ncbi:unnamed protein product [Paramecium sonneborni]|uniref:Transmembrane protein n=1 Tax=Paramecium sonneborni TaxID=65129 RepID=A0A8S1RUM0_9CILI|nr:unnamed protein product [Paramecium sonneborni]
MFLTCCLNVYSMLLKTQINFIDNEIILSLDLQPPYKAILKNFYIFTKKKNLYIFYLYNILILLIGSLKDIQQTLGLIILFILQTKLISKMNYQMENYFFKNSRFLFSISQIQTQ